MKYKLQNIRITKGNNSRGEYAWLQADLFNDADPFANPARLPRYYNMTDAVIAMYDKYTEQVTENGETFNKVNEASLVEAIKNGETPDILHIDHIFAVEYPLPEYYARVYRTDRIENGILIGKAGDFITGKNGEVIPTNTLTLYLKKGYDPDSNEWVFVERPEQVARRVLERNYKRYELKTQQAEATAPAMSPEPPTTAPAETKEQEIARLKAQLEAAGVQ